MYFDNLTKVHANGARLNSSMVLIAMVEAGRDPKHGKPTYARACSLRHKTKPVRSCKCLNLEAVRGVPYASLYHILKKSAATQKHTCALTFRQFLEYTKTRFCHYCDAPVTWAKHNISTKKRGNYNLDRKDNSKGYSIKNCVVCCTVCNLTRGNRFTYEQFVEIGKLLNKMRAREDACSYENTKKTA